MQDKQSQRQAHNLTRQEVKELQNKQVNGDAIDQLNGNVDEKYEFPAHEKHLVHAEIWIPEFDRTSGIPISKPRVQKYSEREFKDQTENNGFAGYKVNILHDPSKTGKVTDGIKPNSMSGQSLGDRHTVEGTFDQLLAGKKVTPEQLDSADKDIKKMTKDELIAKYTQLFGEAPNQEVLKTKADFVAKITERIEFLAKEAEDNQTNPPPTE